MESQAGSKGGKGNLLRKYNVNSASRGFNKRMGAALKFYEGLKFGSRDATVHPKTLSWMRSVFRKWSNQREFALRYRSDTDPSVSSLCDKTKAAFAGVSVDGIVYCPKGMSTPMVMAGTLLHEIRHLDVGGLSGMGHVTCKVGKLRGQSRCDESIVANPLGSQNGAYAANVFYFHAIHKMAKNVSAYEKAQAKNYGEYYLNSYINRPKQTRAIRKNGRVWEFR